MGQEGAPTGSLGKEEDGQPAWPKVLQLEQWLMNTAKDGDRAATFLRKLLQMNPSYGVYLASDDELGEIVQSFAKRFRAKIMSSESPIKPSTLYQPLCEVVWRAIGLVLHQVIELEESEHCLVPKEAQGQIRMLLNTNIELSGKLNDMRRAYLKELSLHRDRERNLSKGAQSALLSLKEQPVMFFEPLEFILDETTKNFVRECVEERVKLEQRGGPAVVDEGIEERCEGLEAAMRSKEAEMRTLRATNAREVEARKRMELDIARMKEEFEKEKEAMLAAFEEERTQFRNEIDEKTRRIASLEEQKLSSMGDAGKTITELRERIVEIERVVIEWQTKYETLQELCASRESEISQLKEQVKKVTASYEELQAQAPTVVTNTKVEQVVDDTPWLAKIDKHLAIEKELREANKALEQALAEEQARGKALNGSSDADAKARKQADLEVETAIKKLTEQFKKELQEKDAKIRRLEVELAKLQGGLTDAEANAEAARLAAEEEARRNKKALKDMAPDDDGDKVAKWRQKFHELEDKHNDLQHEYEILEQKVQMLLGKLREKLGDDAVTEVLMKIKLTPAPPKRQRKKKAYERLYDDAQRRIVEMRMKQEKLAKLQEQALVDATTKVKDRRALRQVEGLNHLQKAAKATVSRFHEAISAFQSLNNPGETGDMDAAGETGGMDATGDFDAGASVDDLQPAYAEGFQPSFVATDKGGNRAYISPDASTDDEPASHQASRQSMGGGFHAAHRDGGSLAGGSVQSGYPGDAKSLPGLPPGVMFPVNLPHGFIGTCPQCGFQWYPGAPDPSMGQQWDSSMGHGWAQAVRSQVPEADLGSVPMLGRTKSQSRREELIREERASRGAVGRTQSRSLSREESQSPYSTPMHGRSQSPQQTFHPLPTAPPWALSNGAAAAAMDHSGAMERGSVSGMLAAAPAASAVAGRLSQEVAKSNAPWASPFGGKGPWAKKPSPRLGVSRPLPGETAENGGPELEDPGGPQWRRAPVGGANYTSPADPARGRLATFPMAGQQISPAGQVPASGSLFDSAELPWRQGEGPGSAAAAAVLDLQRSQAPMGPGVPPAGMPQPLPPGWSAGLVSTPYPAPASTLAGLLRGGPMSQSAVDLVPGRVPAGYGASPVLAPLQHEVVQRGREPLISRRATSSSPERPGSEGALQGGRRRSDGSPGTAATQLQPRNMRQTDGFMQDRHIPGTVMQRKNPWPTRCMAPGARSVPSLTGVKARKRDLMPPFAADPAGPPTASRHVVSQMSNFNPSASVQSTMSTMSTAGSM